jgi:hypothetical protein
MKSLWSLGCLEHAIFSECLLVIRRAYLLISELVDLLYSVLEISVDLEAIHIRDDQERRVI